MWCGGSRGRSLGWGPWPCGDSLERLAGRVRLSEAMLGLVIALAADSPEITSGVTASVHGQTDIGAGVVLGSNVFNLAALLGLGAIVARRIKPAPKGGDLRWPDRHVDCPADRGSHLRSTRRRRRSGFGPGRGRAYIVISASSSPTLRRLGLPPRPVAWLHIPVAEEESELAGGIHPVGGGRWDVATAGASLVVIASAIMERSAETLGKHFHLPSIVVGGVVLAAVTSLPNAVGAVFLASRGRGRPCSARR